MDTTTPPPSGSLHPPVRPCLDWYESPDHRAPSQKSYCTLHGTQIDVGWIRYVPQTNKWEAWWQIPSDWNGVARVATEEEAKAAMESRIANWIADILAWANAKVQGTAD